MTGYNSWLYGYIINLMFLILLTRRVIALEKKLYEDFDRKEIS